MRITILGCGGSNGVPTIGGPDGAGDWGACDPANPKNRRRRASIVVQQDAEYLLVDTSPDLRDQLLDAGMGRISAVLYTHDHADHTHGVNELRLLARTNGRPMAVYGNGETLALLRRRFAFAFGNGGVGPYPPILTATEIAAGQKFGTLTVTPFAQDHGFGGTTLGYRFDGPAGAAAYSTDVVEMPAAAFQILDGLDVWIVDCTRETPHPTHSHLARTLEWIERVRPRRAVLTHMDESLDYEALRAKCPARVEPAFDGMTIDL